MAAIEYFSRNASGLVRTLKARDVFTFNVIGYSIGLVLSATPGFIVAQNSAMSLSTLLVVGASVALINVLFIGWIAGAFPRSGGEYAFVSRGLNTSVGFMASWWFAASQVFGLGAYAVWATQQAFGPTFSLIGLQQSSELIASFGTSISSGGLPSLIFALALLGLTLALTLLPLKTVSRVLAPALALALVGTAVLLFRLSASEISDVENALLTYSMKVGTDSAEIIELFRSGTTPTVESSASPSLVTYLPLGYWMFIGITYSAYLGSEVQQPLKNQLTGMVVAAALGAGFYFFGLNSYFDLLNTDAILSLSSIAQLESSPMVAGEGMFPVLLLLAKPGFEQMIGSLAFLLWYFLILSVILQVCVRTFMAWSLDSIIPEWWKEVSDKSATPVNSTLGIVAIASIIAAFVAYELVPFGNYVALFSAAYALVAVAAFAIVITPKLRSKSLFATYFDSPLKLSTFGVLAGINAVVFSLMFWESISSPAFSGVEPGIASGLFLTFVTLFGALVFYLSKSRRKSNNIDTIVLPIE